MLPEDEHVVRVKPAGKISGYISYSSEQLADPQKGRVHLVARDKAIGKAISVAEILKRKVNGLHQQTTLSSLPREKKNAGKQSGCTGDVEKLESCITIALAKTTEHMDVNALGYVPAYSTLSSP